MTVQQVEPNNTGLGYYTDHGVPHHSSQSMTPHPTLFLYFLLTVSLCLYIAIPAIPSLKVRSLSGAILSAQPDSSDPVLLQ